MAEYTYTVIFEPDLEDGGYVASVPALGIATQGETLEEARRMAQQAIQGYLEGLLEEGQAIPQEPQQVGDQIHTELVAVTV